MYLTIHPELAEALEALAEQYGLEVVQLAVDELVEEALDAEEEQS